MGLTVNELVELPHLRTTWLAGRAGGDRSVLWAHVCELEAPWEWLGSGDLLMTAGITVPADPDEQAKFIANLDDAGLAGVAIGMDHHAPPLTAALERAAEERDFPVLATAYEVPFVAVARAVTLANQDSEHTRLVRTLRVYDVFRATTAAGKPPADFIAALGKELDCELYILDERGLPIFSGSPAVPRGVSETIPKVVRERGAALPSVLRFDVGGRAGAMVPVPSERFAVLVALTRKTRPPDLAILQHTATVAGLEVEKLSSQREERRRTGAELFAALLDGNIDPVVAEERLRAHRFSTDSLVVAAIRSEESEHEGLHHHLSDASVAHLMLQRDHVLLALIHDAPTALELLEGAVSDGSRVGMSGAFSGARGAGDAVREALWALASAQAGRKTVRYGDAAPLFMPRTMTETTVVIDTVLGRLIDYDNENGSDFIASLRAFLTCNRSWQRTCEHLHIHKQTLVYRMQRVEQLTGRSLRETNDVAELWLALQAYDAVLGASTTPMPGSHNGV